MLHHSTEGGIARVSSATNQPMLVLDLDPAITATAAIAALAAF